MKQFIMNQSFDQSYLQNLFVQTVLDWNKKTEYKDNEK